MFFQPEIETMPREELRELQLERMRESLRNAYENVPLYRERFDAAGVTPDDLTSLEDIAKFPFVVKQDMRDNYPFGMFAAPRTPTWPVIHASSGTTGQATVVGLYRTTTSRYLGRLLRPRHCAWLRRRTRTPPSRCPTATACSPAAWALMTAARPSGLHRHPHLVGQHRAPGA